MRATIPTSISVALLALVGCGKPVPAGSYRGERKAEVATGTDPVVASQLRRVRLEIAADGWATLEDGGIPWEGRMSRSGERLDFEVFTVAGINIEKQPASYPRTLHLLIEPDGTLQFDSVRLAPEGR